MNNFKLFIFLAVMIISANSYGQKNCDEAVPLSTFNSAQDYLMDNDQYWLSFTADSIDFYLALLLPNSYDPTPIITTINLYTGNDCWNLTLEKTIDLQTDSILTAQLSIGINYYIEVIHDGSNNGIFTLYCANTYKTAIPPPSCTITPSNCFSNLLINPNTQFDDISINLNNALNNNPPDPNLIIDPMTFIQSTDVCNWGRYNGSPQIVKDALGNYYLYMWAYSLTNLLGSSEQHEAAFNRLTGVTVPGGVGLISGHTYSISLKYREEGAEGVSGFRIVAANENATLTGLDPTPQEQIVDYSLSTLPNTTGFNNYSTTYTPTINFNAVYIYPYQIPNGEIYSGIDIDDFEIREILPSPIPLTLSLDWGKSCSEWCNFNFTMPSTTNITYTWFVPNNAVITSIQAPNNIAVNWNNAGIATITVEGRNTTTGCLVYFGTLLVNPNQTPCPTATYTMNNINATQIKAMFGGASTITTSQLITINGTISINESINIDACSNIKLGLNAKINVMPGCTLNIFNSTLSACDCYWDGIFVESPTAFLNIENSFVSQAKNAVVSSNNGRIYLYNSTFTDNNIGTWVRRYNPEILGYDQNGDPILPPSHRAVIKKCKYERINNASIGIMIDTVYNLTIGDVNIASNVNEFKNLNRSIHSTASDVYIYNNYFNNNLYSSNANPNYLYSEPSDAAIFIYKPYYQGPPPPLPNTIVMKNIVTIGGAATNQANTFYMQNIGVYGFNTQVNVFNNTFTEQRFSAVHLRELYKSDINFNTVTMQNNTWATNNLYNSTILTEIINGFSTTRLNINSNTINNTRTGINTRNCNGDDVDYYCNITSNIIHFSNVDLTNNHKYFGISASNEGFAVIESNNINYDVEPTSTTNYHEGLYGIYLSTVTNTKVSLNFTTHMGDGIYIAGNSLASQYFCNYFVNNWYGFYFNYPILSHQLLSPIGNNNTSDNCWYDILPVSSITALRRMEGGLSPSSYPVNWYNRALNNDITNIRSPYIVDFPDPLFSRIVPQQNQAANANCISWIEMNPSGREALLGSIVRDSMNYQIFPEENEYMGKEFAYKTLDKNPTSLTLFVPEDSIYQNFYTTTKLSNIGKNDEVSKAVNAKDYTTAFNLNAAIVPQNTIETNRKTVYGIFLEKLVNNIKLPTIDSLTLLAIALQTPFVGGDAVYSARVILGIDPLQYNLDYAIAPIHQPQTALKNNELKIYPNPANNHLSVELTNEMQGTIVIDIYDMNGKLVFNQLFNTKQKSQNFDVSNLTKGIYNLRIKANEDIVKYQKLVIIK